MATQATQANYPDKQANGLEFWNAAWALYNGNNYGEALPILKQGADLGNFDCFETLAYMYDNGLGLEQDHQAALEWYKSAAGEGDTKAMNEVIFRYEKGFFDIPSDTTQAQYWKDKLAEATLPTPSPDETPVETFWNQGWALYEAGDYAGAIPLFCKGASLGNFDCYESIAYMYDNGLGFSADHAAALHWYERAGELGDKKAMGEIIYRYEHGLFEIVPDARKAHYWKEKLANTAA